MQTSRDTVPAVVVEGESTTELEVPLMKKKKNDSLRNEHQSHGPKQIGPQPITNSNSLTLIQLLACKSDVFQNACHER